MQQRDTVWPPATRRRLIRALQQRDTVWPPATRRRLIRALQRSPGLRSVTYLTGAAVVLRTVSGLYKQHPDVAEYALHLTIFPLALTWTYLFVHLREEDRQRWQHVSLRRGLAHAGIGVGLGVGAFLLVIGSAAAAGWIRLPAWGWEQASPTAVARTVLLTVPETLAAAWNEEMVFRGYGFDTTSAALGQPAALVALTGLFAWGHGRGMDLRVLVGMGAAGLALMALRLRTGGLWMPIGYHFAWNYMQTAVFGPADGPPSLRPLYITGPAVWIGSPGHPEPGLLALIVHLLVACLSIVLWRRSSESAAE